MFRKIIFIIALFVLFMSGFSWAANQSKDKNKIEQLKCANLIYAGSKSSVCFSSMFLETVNRETNCETSTEFTPVRLAKEDMFEYPFAVMTGEGQFNLLDKERQMLKSYLTRGGFLLASAGCSSIEWDKSFRKEINRIFPNNRMKKISMNHSIFHTVFEIKSIALKRGGTTQLEGLEIDGKIVLIYSPEGLNDTANAGKKSGGAQCCCCGGNEIKNSQEINVNIFTYALTH
ncbi:MAG: DUF4159 domain-containing protein [Sedimentisphaerales bacterium]|nr:DUF4159 domain-containing protein [Sedimentisphaerales bacterium]